MDNQIENLEGEIWKDVVGYEGLYQVSSIGRVKSLHKNKEIILKGGMSTSGYPFFSLSKNGDIKYNSTHRFIAIAFLDKKDEHNYVNHKNGIKVDNRVENLEWCTQSENLLHSYATLNRKGAQRKLTDDDVREIRRLFTNGESSSDILKIFPIKKRSLNSVKNYKTYKRVI